MKLKKKRLCLKRATDPRGKKRRDKKENATKHGSPQL
jgi:hypothetical protein